VQFNTKTNRVYVSSQFTVTVLDSATDTIIANIPVPAAGVPNLSGYNGIYQSYVDDLTNTIYSLSESGVVTAINGATNTIKSTFAPLPTSTITNVDGMVCNPETGKLYMSLWNPGPNGGGIAYVVVWDTREQKTVAILPNAREWFAVNRKTNRIYYDSSPNQISVINGATDEVIDIIEVGPVASPQGCVNNCVTQVSDLKQLAVDEERNRIYVVGINNGLLATIDGNTDTVIATAYYDYFLYSLAVDPVRNRIYAIDNDTNVMVIIDGASGRRLGNLSVSPGPFPMGCADNASQQVNPNITCVASATVGGTQGIGVNPVNGKIYTGYSGDYFSFVPGVPNAYGYVTVLQPTATTTGSSPGAGNGTNEAFAATVTLAVGAGAIDAVVNTRTNTLYIANSGANTVSALNLTSLSVTATIPVGASPHAIAIDESTNALYTFNGDGPVSVFDSGRNELVSNFPVDTNASGLLGLNPQAIAYSRTTGTLYAINGFNQIDVVNPITRQVLTTIPDADAASVAINQSTNTIYVSQYSEGTVWVIDGATDRRVGVIANVSLPALPPGCYQAAGGPNSCLQMSSGLTKIAIDEALNRIYVLGQYDGSVVTIDGRTNRVIGEQFINSGGYSMAVNPNTHAVFADNFFTPALWALDGQSGSVGSVVNFNSLGCNTDFTTCYDQTDLKSVTVNPATGSIYILDQGDLNPQNTSLLYIVNPARPR